MAKNLRVEGWGPRAGEGGWEMEEGLRGKGQRGGRKKGEGRYCRQSNKEECGGKGGVREEERAGGGGGGAGGV